MSGLRILLFSFFFTIVLGSKSWATLKYRVDPSKELNSDKIRIQLQNGPTVFARRKENGTTYDGMCRVPFKPDNSIVLRFDEVDFVQKDVIINLNPNGDTRLRLYSDDYRLALIASGTPFVHRAYFTDDNGCSCITRQCACCLAVDYEPWNFKHAVCVNATYNAADIGLDISVGIDGHYLTERISVRNPPPICLDIPYTKEIAEACIAFQHLDVSKKVLSGCVEAELSAIHMKILRIPLGCFKMPI